MRTACSSFIGFLLPALSAAQWLSVGVTGGVPVSPQSQHSAPAYLFTEGTYAPNDLILKPYLVGGTAQVRLRWNFSVVAEFQYERMHQDFAFAGLIRGTNGANFGTVGSAAANIWQFPLLLRRDFGRSRISPFVDAGATLRHLGAFDGKGYQIDFQQQVLPQTVHANAAGNPDVAITAGAGIRTRILSFDLLAGIRYLHWTSSYFIPAQNQGVLTLSLMFPARR